MVRTPSIGIEPMGPVIILSNAFGSNSHPRRLYDFCLKPFLKRLIPQENRNMIIMIPINNPHSPIIRPNPASASKKVNMSPFKSDAPAFVPNPNPYPQKGASINRLLMNPPKYLFPIVPFSPPSLSEASENRCKNAFILSPNKLK